jgi:predicted transposase YbfD/YdcC
MFSKPDVAFMFVYRRQNDYERTIMIMHNDNYIFGITYKSSSYHEIREVKNHLKSLSNLLLDCNANTDTSVISKYILVHNIKGFELINVTRGMTYEL